MHTINLVQVYILQIIQKYKNTVQLAGTVFLNIIIIFWHIS